MFTGIRYLGGILATLRFGCKSFFQLFLNFIWNIRNVYYFWHTNYHK